MRVTETQREILRNKYSDTNTQREPHKLRKRARGKVLRERKRERHADGHREIVRETKYTEKKKRKVRLTLRHERRQREKGKSGRQKEKQCETQTDREVLRHRERDTVRQTHTVAMSKELLMFMDVGVN